MPNSAYVAEGVELTPVPAASTSDRTGPTERIQANAATAPRNQHDRSRARIGGERPTADETRMRRRAFNLECCLSETATLIKASDRSNSALAQRYRLADRWALLERGVWNGALGGRGAGFG